MKLLFEENLSPSTSCVFSLGTGVEHADISTMSTLEMTFEELKSLPPAKRQEAAGYIGRLKLSSVQPQNEALTRSFGCLTSAEAEDLDQVIARNCES